jgi:TfoX/Sxy family transcriptional regulator of competence genes
MADRSKISYEKSSSALVDLFQDLAPKGPAVEQRKMFGWPCCFVNGNLFFGLHKQTMIFRLPASDFREFLRHQGAMNFEPMPGRKSKGFVAAAGPMLEDRKALARWIARAFEHAQSMPKKPQKSAKRPTKR